uniref:Uncharacterized protein n=2 Tax=Felinae TaxID=338152 RepID=A0ABI7X0B1_FELCA
MTMEASFRALDAFISPSAVTLARASRDASASAAIALWSCTGSFTSLISTRSTFIPQSSVASSRVHCQEERRQARNAQPSPEAYGRALGSRADRALGESRERAYFSCAGWKAELGGWVPGS